MAEPLDNVLRGKRVAVTRAAEQSGPLADALRQAGAIPIFIPMIAFAPPLDTSALDNALRNLHKFDWVFFTSQNAVRAVHERASELHLSMAESLSHARVTAVGPATADAAVAAGLPVAHIAEKHQGSSLATELASQLNGAHILLPRSDRANPDLPNLLRHSGATVTEVVAYRTLPPSADESLQLKAALSKPLDAILFFSPSSVHHFIDLAGSDAVHKLAASAHIISIGPVTQHALQVAGIHSASSSEATIPAVLSVLANAFSQSPQNRSAGVHTL